MDSIKLAEEMIKDLKDYIEIEKTLKRVVTPTVQDDLIDLSINVRKSILEKAKSINIVKGE